MNRVGLLITLAIAGVTGLVFALSPALDVAISRYFFDASAQIFPASFVRPLAWFRASSMWVVAAFAVPAGVALAVKLAAPHQKTLVGARAGLFLLTTLAIGPGLLANVTFKDNWGRPRPTTITEFGGPERFVPWWDPRGACPKNCSFVGGESAGAFWLLAPAALTPLAWRAFAYAGALAFGSLVGALRIAFGGHFFSDVVFSGVLVFLVIWLMHGLMYRWKPEWFGDEAIASMVARLRGAQPIGQ